MNLKETMRKSFRAYLLLAIAATGPLMIEPAYCSTRITSYQQSLTTKNIPGLSRCRYPQFKGLRHQRKINALVKAKVKREVKSFLSNKPGDRYSAYCEVTTMGGGILSIVLKFRNLDTKVIDGYSCLNLNTRTYQSLHLDDLLDHDLGSREVFAILVLEQFSKKKLEFSPGLLVSELYADPTNLENFSLSKDCLTFYFNPTAVTAGALGAQQVVIPISRVKKLIGPASPLRSLYLHKLRSSIDGIDSVRCERDLYNLAVQTYSRLIARDKEDSSLYGQRARWYEKLGLKDLAKRDRAREEGTSSPQKQ